MYHVVMHFHKSTHELVAILHHLNFKDQKNKRPMGHIAHLRKQFKSINTIDYIIMLIKRRKKTLLSLWELNGSSLNKIESHSPKDALCQVWLILVQWFWRRRFFNFVNVFSLFRNYLPLEKGGALDFNNLESPSPKDAFC